MDVFIGFVVIVILGGGWLFGNRPGERNGLVPVARPEPQSPSGDCLKDCTDWYNASIELCRANKNVTAALGEANSARNLLLAAAAAAAALSIAAAAASAAATAAASTIFGIPAALVLQGIALGLGAAAAAAFVTVAAYAGNLANAEGQLRIHRDLVNRWQTEVNRLRQQVLLTCPADKANACLGRAIHC